MPINADQRRRVPINAETAENATAVLLRSRVLDAVAVAQERIGGPVTSYQAHKALGQPVLRHARRFAAVAARVAQLGADDRGRVLRAAGRDRKGFALWWVQDGSAA